MTKTMAKKRRGLAESLFILVMAALVLGGCATPPPPTTELNIQVTAPTAGEAVSSPFTVRGSARVFENQLSWRLKEENGRVLAEGLGQALAPDVGQFGPFATSIAYGLPQAGKGVLEVFNDSAKDGSEENKVSIPLRLEASAETVAIQAFFSNDTLDPAITCEKVFPVERKVRKVATLAQAAVEELLKGPSAEEKAKGFGTAINPNVKINRLAIVDGVAQVDFDYQLESQVAGSCRVGLIRRQIVETLRQFPSVKTVAISVESRKEGVLQP